MLELYTALPYKLVVQETLDWCRFLSQVPDQLAGLFRCVILHMAKFLLRGMVIPNDSKSCLFGSSVQ